jgi:membrane-bound lytic murein transglycosylase D
MILGKHPERFGLMNLEPMTHANPVEIHAGPLTDLATVSKISGAPYEQLLNLNAQYLYGCTPPDHGQWVIHVPRKYALDLQEKMNSLKPEERNEFVRYKLRKGESVSSLARRYRLPAKIVMEANYLKSLKSAKRDMILVIPKRTTGPPPRVEDEPSVRQTAPGRFTVKYTVGDGDSLWRIAKKADVEIQDVCTWNNIKRDDYIYPGHTLILHISDSSTARRVALEGQRNRQDTLNGPSALVSYHTVKSGQTLSGIARKYGITSKEIISWNNLSAPYHIHAGQKLKIYR